MAGRGAVTGAAKGAGGGSQVRGFFRVIKSAKSVRGAEQMIRYIAFRSRDVQDKEKGCFDRETDHAHIGRFVDRLPDHLTRHSQAPKAMHCIFSLSRYDSDRCGLTDWREIVRDFMSTYERETGRRLEWIAAQHDNEAHPHCHVIIKAVYETEDGRRRKLWLSRDDLKLMRGIATRHLDYHREQNQALDRGAGPEESRQMPKSAEFGLSLIQNMIRQERRRRLEAERDHQRWLREDDSRGR